MSESIPSTKTLDHIVHLTPPGTVRQVSRQFKDLGFNVIAGGKHTGGLTENCLVILADGAYLELISFTHPASHYPPGSPDRQRRDDNQWAHKDPGWIDFAFHGSVITSISRVINERAEREHSGICYSPETHGGRTRTDGRVLKWVLSTTKDDYFRGTVPFFCGDVTPWEWRVPVDPPSNVIHPSGVQGVAYVLLGEPPQHDTANSEYTWTLEVHLGAVNMKKPRLILSAPKDDEERDHLNTRGPGIFEVGFSLGRCGVERESKTPYGKIVFVKSM
ncbi:hypothetical protein JVU11DRAFT_137 [Chiua virens]|nr:hypothetical protein JVU11DRAFT_137 [Chiua virens]